MAHRALAALLIAVGLMLAPTPASAAACAGTSGVTVVVQFPDNHVETGCAAGDPDSGLRALELAGFSYAFVPGQAPAICAINGSPGSDCWGKDHYWAYFHANRGGSWSYANSGATYNPPAGSVEGWRFGDGAAPTTPPPAAVAPKPSPSPTAEPTPSTGGGGRASGQGSGSGSGSGAPGKPSPTAAIGANGAGGASNDPDSSATGSARDRPRAKPDKAGSEPSSAATTAGEGPDVAAEDEVATASGPTTTPSEGGGTGRGWLWGLLILAAVAGAGGVTALRRRRG